jgi:hypothetical protein
VIVGKQWAMNPVTRLTVVLAIALALAVPVLTAGCGASTPQQAVNDFYKSIQARNWNAYLGSVLPDNVRRMTQTDIQDQKKKFLQQNYTYEGLKYKTIIDPKDKNKADVELTSGTISGTDPTTNQKQSTTIEEIKKSYNITPTIKAVRFRGNWYVDLPMASADQQQTTQELQQQQQQTQ